MPQPSPAQDTNVADMAAFVAKYGGETLEQLDEKPNTAAPEPRQSLPPESGSETGGGEEATELDAATLQALGLDQEDPPSPSDDAEGDTTQEPEIDLGLFARHLGVKEDEITLDNGELKVRTKVDGEEALTPLSDLRTGYQLRQHFTRQNEEFLRQKQQWEQATQQRETQIAQQEQLAIEVLKADEQALDAQYTRNWDQLRQEDPSEYAAQVADYKRKKAELRTRQEGLMQSQQQRATEQQQQQQQWLQQQREQGVAYLSEQLGWKDQEQFTKGAERLRGYLQKGLNLQPQEIDTILDPRVLIAAEKARQFDELQAKIATARKKVTESHKMPTGTSPKPAGGKRQKVQQSMKRLHNSGTVEAAADVFKNLGIV